jgi:hypothetical protein
VTIFGPFFGPSSDPYTRTHKIITYITLKKEISFFKKGRDLILSFMGSGIYVW